jgi:hypothetical protein
LQKFSSQAYLFASHLHDGPLAKAQEVLVGLASHAALALAQVDAGWKATEQQSAADSH